MDTYCLKKKKSSRSLLQEAARLPRRAGAGEHGLGLAQAVHLLVESRLAGVEVVEREVAALVEVRVLVHELLLLVQRSGESLLLRYLVRLSSRLLLALVGDVTRLLFHGRVGVLHERLVSLLRIRLRLHGLRLGDDLLEHAHHPSGAGGLLVRLEARRR